MANRPTTSEQLFLVVAAWRKYNRNISAAAQALGVGRTTLGSQLEQAERRGLVDRDAERRSMRQGAPEPPAQGLDVTRLHRRVVALEDENTSLRRDLREAARNYLDTEKVREEILGLTSKSPDPPNWLTSVGGHEDDGPGVPMTLWSDWHWAEVVRREEVGGVNEFNVEIAHQRVRRLVNRIITLAFDHQVHSGYPGLVLCLGGDMISGEIHQELAESNEMRTLPAVLDLRDVLIWAIERLVEAFGRLFIPCVIGNHGRATMKPRAKSRMHTSYEWMLYTLLEKHFSGRPEIQFLVPNDIDVLFRVGTTRYLLTHGDALGVKGGDGIIGALGPIMRGAIKTRHSNAQVGKDFDVILMGHWHQYLALRWIIVNGALKGFDEYARTFLRASFERPIQAMWYDHPRVGITKHEPIYLEDRSDATASSGWVDVFTQAR